MTCGQRCSSSKAKSPGTHARNLDRTERESKGARKSAQIGYDESVGRILTALASPLGLALGLGFGLLGGCKTIDVKPSFQRISSAKIPCDIQKITISEDYVAPWVWSWKATCENKRYECWTHGQLHPVKGFEITCAPERT